MKKLLRDNGLLFDRPWSYWTMATVWLLLVYQIFKGNPNVAPWLIWAASFNTATWVGVFMKGGGWEWAKEKIPERWLPAAKEKQ